MNATRLVNPKRIAGVGMSVFVLQLIVAFLVTGDGVAVPPPSRILFIGNSYTSVNGLPAIVKQIASSAGYPVPTMDASLPGGLTLQQHSKLPATLSKIDEGNWDVVVIQGQSKEAAMAEQHANMRASFKEGTAELCNRIKAKSPHVRIVFYETWARHADYWLVPKADKAVGNNPADMQARIRKWYRQVAQSAQKQSAMVAPVGDAWELNYKSATPLTLHAKDNSHPVFGGSYLAAMVIYATIYHPPTLAIPYRGALSESEALRLQDFALQAVKANAKQP